MNADQDRPILVTGGAGFIGSHLVEELVRRGARVTVVDDLSAGVLDNLAGVLAQIEFRPLDLARDDLRPLLAERSFDAVFHVAGNAYVPASVDDPRADFEKNVIGTFNVLEAVRAVAAPSRLIYTSSATVCDEQAPMPLREDCATLPISPYGVGKLAGERYVAVYSRLYGLRAGTVRLFPVYGPRLRKQVVFDLIRKVHENPDQLFIYGDGTQVRDLNHVANVVEALLLVKDRAPLQGEVYNVASDEPVSIRQLARLICDHLEADPRFVFSGDVRPGDAQRWAADISRLKALGYRPRVSLAAGLADTVAWFGRCVADAKLGG